MSSRRCEFCGAPFEREADNNRTRHCSADCRFLSDVEIGPAGACWIWKGHTSPNGYGSFSYAGTKYSAHRFMRERIERTVQRYGSAIITLHHCDVRPCVNPRHIYGGSYAQNNLDAVNRGRWRGPKRSTRNAQGRFSCG